MYLTEWIDSMGGSEKVAELLGEKPRTVYSWYRLDRAPGWTVACKIVERSKGRVDFNGIYKPMCAKLNEQVPK